MNIDSIGSLLDAGTQLLVLLPIPAAAVVCAIALAIGLHRRIPSVIVGATVSAVAVGVAAMALRSSSTSPEAVDSLVMLLPIALAIAALPTLVRAVPLAVRVARRAWATGWAHTVIRGQRVAGAAVIAE